MRGEAEGLLPAVCSLAVCGKKQKQGAYQMAEKGQKQEQTTGCARGAAAAAGSGAKTERTVVAAAAAYLALTLFANLGSLRAVMLGPFAMDGGALLYPFTFTARDLLHKKSGAALTRFVILLAAVANLLLFAYLRLVGGLPADPAVGPQTEYLLVLAPGLRLVVASVLAMTVAELLDTTIYQAVRRRLGSRRQWLRVLLSNLVSIPVDTAIFLFAAFGGQYDAATIGAMFVSNLLIKYLVTVISLGSVYLVREDRA